MSYRGPNRSRIAAQQSEAQFAHAGQVATWRQYLSASASVPAAGLGSIPVYRETTITALFGAVNQPETPMPGGNVAGAEIYAVTREAIGREDVLVWRGVSYRVEGVPSPARLAGTWTVMLRRAAT